VTAREYEAGRELDALVATKVMGVPLESMCERFLRGRCDGERWTHCGACGSTGHGNCYGLFAGGRVWGSDGLGEVQVPCADNCGAPHYSTYIAAAWKVVEKMAERGYSAQVIQSGNEDFAWVHFYRTVAYEGDESRRVVDKATGEFATADTAPLAICRASLRACGVEAP
jgi:hypothetical protein